MTTTPAPTQQMPDESLGPLQDSFEAAYIKAFELDSCHEIQAALDTAKALTPEDLAQMILELSAKEADVVVLRAILQRYLVRANTPILQLDDDSIDVLLSDTAQAITDTAPTAEAIRGKWRAETMKNAGALMLANATAREDEYGTGWNAAIAHLHAQVFTIAEINERDALKGQP